MKKALEEGGKHAEVFHSLSLEISKLEGWGPEAVTNLMRSYLNMFVCAETRSLQEEAYRKESSYAKRIPEGASEELGRNDLRASLKSQRSTRGHLFRRAVPL